MSPTDIVFMLSILLAIVNGQGVCITANNTNGNNGLPTFQDYHFGPDLSISVIPHLHQVIIPSYRFNCCGNITEWGVDVQPDGSHFDEIFTLDLQVWRPSPTVEMTGCYSLVGNNSFTSVELQQRVAIVTPLPQQRIQFQPGDVLGFYVESAQKEGVVLLSDVNKKGDRGYETEEVWYARRPEFGNISCPYPVGSRQVLNTFTRAAPVISLSINSMECPHSISPFTSHLLSSVILKTTVMQRSKSAVNPNSQSVATIGLITGVATTILVVVVIILLTLTVVGAMAMCRRNQRKNKVPTTSNEAYEAVPKGMAVHIEEDTYDYPTISQHVMDSINTTQNEAYATSTEVVQSISHYY